MTYLTLGSLFADFQTSGEPSQYERELDIKRAMATTTFHQGDLAYERTAFASMADSVIVWKVKVNQKESLISRCLMMFPCPMK